MKIVIAIVLLLCASRLTQAIEFVVADPVINDLEISVAASVSGTQNNYYLQGTLRSVDSSKYFGETENGRGSWIDYLSVPDKEFITSNFFLTDVRDASWSGVVKLRYKVDDPIYKGPGNYELKLRRFTGGSSNSAGESNTLVVTLTGVLPVPSPSPAQSPLPSLPPSSPSPSPQASSVPAPSPSPETRSSPSPILTTPLAVTVAGESVIDLSAFGIHSPEASISPSPPDGDVLTLRHERVRIVLLIGGGLLLVAVAGYLIVRRMSSSTRVS